MKRIAIALGTVVVTVFLVAPSVAGAGNVAQVRSQVRPQVVESQIVESQVVRQVVRQGLVRQQVRSQQARVLRLSPLRAQIR